MSGSAQRWVLRLSTEGADQVVRDLRAAATESAAGARAYDALIKARQPSPSRFSLPAWAPSRDPQPG